MTSVYFWGGPHPINESFITSPPDGVILKSNLSTGDFFKIGEYAQRQTFLKAILTSGLKTLGLPRVALIKTDCDAIHTNGGVIPLSNHLYFVTIEHASSFLHLDDDLFASDYWKRMLISFLIKKRCKKILPYSEATRLALEYGLEQYYDKIKEKVEVLYPAIDAKIHYKDYPRIKNKESFHILFISRHFFDDGCRELIEACKRLSNNYDITVDIITNPPSHHIQYFEEYTRNVDPTIFRIHRESIPRELLFRDYYSQSDLFVLPTYIHFFGFVLLEAMLYKLPLITTDVYALPEIVENGKNGFIIPAPISCFSEKFLKPKYIVKKYREEILKNEFSTVTEYLKNSIKELIDDDQLRTRMGQNSFELVNSGKFSVKKRNDQLKLIYQNGIES